MKEWKQDEKFLKKVLDRADKKCYNLCFSSIFECHRIFEPDCQALFSTFSRFSFCPLQPDILPQNSLLHNHLSYDTLILS